MLAIQRGTLVAQPEAVAQIRQAMRDISNQPNADAPCNSPRRIKRARASRPRNIRIQVSPAWMPVHKVSC